jgi:hypothetical protein
MAKLEMNVEPLRVWSEDIHAKMLKEAVRQRLEEFFVGNLTVTLLKQKGTIQ